MGDFSKGYAFKHRADTPFPRAGATGTPLEGKQIVDEECLCKHRRSKHYDSVAYGQAQCSLCGCARFTFAHFILNTGQRL